MKKAIYFVLFLFLCGNAMHLHAQSLQNTNWSTYMGAPIADSITMHVRGDSSFVSTSTGEVLVRTKCIISGDTLTIRDYDGKMACADMDGVYIFTFKDGSLALTPVSDPCEGRKQSITTAKWVKVSK